MSTSTRDRVDFSEFDDPPPPPKRRAVYSPAVADYIDSLETTGDGPDKRQMMVIKAAARGENVYCGGMAGTGKSRVLKEIEKVLGLQKIDYRVVAPTGSASLLVGGGTLDAMLCMRNTVNIHDRPVDRRHLSYDKKAELAGIKAVLIDEISMVSLAKFRYILEMVPGVQFVFFGDFYQLPPVATREEQRLHPAAAQFVFEGPEFWDLFPVANMIFLAKIYRQTDPDFHYHSRCLQIGQVGYDTIKYFRQFERELPPDSNPVYVLGRRRDVQARNAEGRNRLLAEGAVMRVFEATQSWSDPDMVRALNNACTSPMSLELCAGMPVRVTSNVMKEKWVVNGATGIVVGFETRAPVAPHSASLDGERVTRDECVGVRLDQTGEVVWLGRYTFELVQRKQVVARRRQYPLVPSFATTTHQLQGAGVGSCVVQVDKLYKGLPYTALTRTFDPKIGLQVTGVGRLAGYATPPPAAIEFEHKVHKARGALGLPNAFTEPLGLVPVPV